ncbi:MAG: NADH-ubiquinone oxidoreductase-F iron-sulfur binding region domain-containing protein [Lachnospiraceae bacterium]
MMEKLKNKQETQCVVDLLLQSIQECECNTCGKCVYGYEGVTQLRLILHDITQKKGKSSDIALVYQLADLMRTQSICEIGTDLASEILYVQKNFGEEFEQHISKKVCNAGVCSGYVTYHILPDKCVGCNECVDACEDDAILGKNKFIHVIEQDECSQCGKCVEACEYDAIVKAGREKPRCPKKPIPCKR